MKFIGDFILGNYINLILLLIAIIIIALYVTFPSRWRWITILAFITITTLIIVFDFFKLYKFGTKYVPDTNNKNFNVNNKWPPVNNKCPDFFSQYNGTDMNIDCEVKNTNLSEEITNDCKQYSDEKAMKEFIVNRENSKSENAGNQISIGNVERRIDNYYKQNEDVEYPLSASEKFCAKKQWAERCNLSWDGITNVNHC
jgi:c-di-AMP phosphodiesterase-like protein